jgi:hypothetical protein
VRETLPVDAVSRHSRPLFALCVLAVVVGGPLLYVRRPLHVDESLYLVVGGQLLDGAGLYTGVIDHKPPAIYHLAALLQMLPGEPYLAFRLLTYAVTAASGVLLFRLGTELRGRTVGAFASLAFLVGTYAPHFDGYYALTEQYAVLCTVAAATLFVERDSRRADLLVGAVLAVGVLFNQIVFLFGLAVVVAVALGLRNPRYRTRAYLRRWTGRLLTIGVGFGVPVALVLGYFASRGALGALLRFTVVVPLTQYSPPFELTGHVYMVLSFLPVWLLAGGMVLVVARRFHANAVDDRLLFLVVWLLLVSYPAVTSFVGDHKTLFALPPASLLGGVAVVRGYRYAVDRGPLAGDDARDADSGGPSRTVAAALVVGVVGVVVLSAGFNAVYASLLLDDTVAEQRASADRVDRHAEGVVYTMPFRQSVVYFADGLESAETYTGIVYSEGMARQVIRDLERQDVRYVVVRRGHYSDDDGVLARGYFADSKAVVADYVDANYERVATTDEYVVLERTGDGAARVDPGPSVRVGGDNDVLTDGNDRFTGSTGGPLDAAAVPGTRPRAVAAETPV